MVGLGPDVAEMLEASYDCVDRVVLNAYFSVGQTPGGFRSWWRMLDGSDARLDDAHLMRLAGRFARRLEAWAKKAGVPVIRCGTGERKHELAEQRLPKDPNFRGVFCVMIARAFAPVWQVQRFGKGGLDPRRKQAFVNHYSFHIIDREWGHVTIKVCGHVPFTAQVIVNGHEFIARQLRREGIEFTRDGNCFTETSNAAGLSRCAETSCQSGTIGRLTVFKVHWGRLTLKVSTKGERLVRIEAIVHNTAELHCRRSLEHGDQILAILRGMLDRFCEVLGAVSRPWIANEMLDRLPESTRVGQRSIAGVDLNRARMRAVVEGLPALATRPRGFQAEHLAEQVSARLHAPYTARQASYDLRKLRAKGMVDKLPNSRRYQISAKSPRPLTARLVIREHVLRPVIANAGRRPTNNTHGYRTAVDLHYDRLQLELENLFETLQLAA